MFLVQFSKLLAQSSRTNIPRVTQVSRVSAKTANFGPKKKSPKKSSKTIVIMAVKTMSTASSVLLSLVPANFFMPTMLMPSPTLAPTPTKRFIGHGVVQATLFLLWISLLVDTLLTAHPSPALPTSTILLAMASTKTAISTIKNSSAPSSKNSQKSFSSAILLS